MTVPLKLIEFSSNLLLFSVLFVFSIIDLKKRQIKNSWFKLVFFISILKIFLDFKIIITEFVFFTVFYLYFTLSILILFSLNFIGGADVKIMILVIMMHNPIQTKGISSIYDGYQFVIFFLFSFIVNRTNILLNNIIIGLNSQICSFQRLSLIDKAKLLSVYKIKRIRDIHRYEYIVITSAYNRHYLFLSNDYFLRCWISKLRALVPLIALSLFLTIIL
jgi:Flp pilus assembly protein protease CpaA